MKYYKFKGSLLNIIYQNVECKYYNKCDRLVLIKILNYLETYLLKIKKGEVS